MKKTLSIEAVHSLYAGELGHALSQVADSAERFKIQYDDDFEKEDSNRKPYTVIDGIAVYKISGPLLSNGSWWSRYLGYSAYDDIRTDLMQAAADRLFTNPGRTLPPTLLHFFNSPGTAA